jgi:uncharacterized protein (DUF58 family)
MSEKLFDEAFLRKLEHLALISRHATFGQVQGERRSPKRGQSVEFSDFRPYVSGDDFRRIDWNAYARLERFFIKLFVEEEDLTVHFLIDISRSMDWGQPNKLEYAIRTAGALGYIALLGLDRITVTALPAVVNANVYLPPLRGKNRALTFFSFLTSLTPAEPEHVGRGIDKQLGAYAANAIRPGPLLLLSDLMDDGWLEGVNHLAAHGFEINILHILAPDEVNPGLNGDIKLIDSENGSGIEITADFEVLEHYRQGLAEWREEWRRYCTVRGIRYTQIDTSRSLESLLFARLRRQGILK